jgi:hypothetical protein
VSLTPSHDWERGYADDWKPYMKGFTPMIWMETKCGVQDMTMVGGPGQKSMIYVATRDWHTVSDDVSIVRMDIETSQRPGNFSGRFEQTEGGVAVMSATRNFTIMQCNVKCADPLILFPVRPQNYGAQIIDNTFTVYPGHNSDDVGYECTTHSIIEDNNLVEGDRALGNGEGFNHNWVFNNTITDDGNHVNAEEMMMSESGSDRWRGKCAAAGPDTIKPDVTWLPFTTLNWRPDMWVMGAKPYSLNDDAYVFIQSGKGFGQYRRIVSNTDDTVTVDSPWDVIPDTTSTFGIAALNFRNLYVDNTVIDCDGRCEFAYGSMVECVVQGTRTRSSEGLSTTAIGGADDKGHLLEGPVAYNDYTWNRMMDLGGIRLQDTAGEGWKLLPDSPPDDGMIVSNRIFYNLVFDFREFALNQFDSPKLNRNGRDDSGISISRGRYNFIGDNYISRGPVAIRLRGGSGNMVQGNVTDDVNTVLDDRSANTFSDVMPAH